MHLIDITPAIEDKLFDALKDADLFTTLSNGNVKLRNTSTYGEWEYVGEIINPHDKENGLKYAEQLFREEKKIAKRLRSRIATWRKNNPDSERIVKYPNMQYSIDRTPPTTAKNLLVALLDANEAVVRADGNSKARNAAIAKRKAVERKARDYLKTS